MPHTVGSELYDATFPLADVREMPRIAVALRHLFARPQGAVVQISVPTDLLDRRCPKLLDPATLKIAPPAPGAAALAQITDWLQRPGGPPAFVLGSGSVAYAETLGALITRMGAVHITTPAALGLLPDSLGLIGTAAEADVAARLRARRPALRLRPRHPAGHRERRRRRGAAAEGLPGRARRRRALRGGRQRARRARPPAALRDVGDRRIHRRARRPAAERMTTPTSIPPTEGADMSDAVNPYRLTAATVLAAGLRRATTALFAESSSAMFFSTYALDRLTEAAHPYARASMHFGSMGHALSGALGFCAVTGQRAIVLTGDGSLHLLNPLPTAVKHGLRLTLVVLNDARLSLPFHGSDSILAFGAQ